MRKILFLVALFMATFTFAQTLGLNNESVRQHAMLQGKTKADFTLLRKNAKVEQLSKEKLQVAMKAPVAEGETAYLVYYAGGEVDFTDAAVAATITVSGATATLEGFSIYSMQENPVVLTGTVSNNGTTITIPPTELYEDFLTDGVNSYSLCFGSITSDGTPTDLVLTQDDYGRFLSTNDMGVLFYAGTTNSYVGYYDWYSSIEMSAMTNLVPYYSSDDYWYYGIDTATGNFASLTGIMGVVSANAGTVDFTSYVTYLNDYDYTMNWQYGKSTSTDDVLQMPVSSSDLSFPTAVAAYNGVNSVAYGMGEGASLTAGGASTIEGVDYGITTWNPWGGMVFPVLSGPTLEYAYGKRTVYLDENTEDKVAGVVCYYPNKGGQFSFAGIDALIVAPQALSGSLKATVISTELYQGFPMIGDTIAYTQDVTLNQMDVFGTTQDGYSYGMLSFADFYQEQDGFDVAVDNVTIDEPFIVVISGFDATEAGIFMDAMSDFSKTVLGMTENVFSLTSTGYLVRHSYYRNPAVIFRGATLSGNGSSIDAVASEDGNIKVGFDGSAWSLTYAEGIRGVQVVNVAGQVVADYALDGTSATIPASALAKGLYILKFDNGQTVKVMK